MQPPPCARAARAGSRPFSPKRVVSAEAGLEGRKRKQKEKGAVPAFRTPPLEPAASEGAPAAARRFLIEVPTSEQLV